MCLGYDLAAAAPAADPRLFVFSPVIMFNVMGRGRSWAIPIKVEQGVQIRLLRGNYFPTSKQADPSVELGQLPSA